MRMIIFLSLVLSISNALAENWEERFKVLEKRTSELEFTQAINRFEFGGEYSLNYDQIDNNDKRNSYRMRVALDVNTAINERVKFYSRLTMDKYFNPLQLASQPGSSNNSNDEGSTPYFQRAYADIKINNNWFFSGGRLPTIEGPPVNYWRNSPRFATYPVRLYNNTFDGIGLTRKSAGFNPDHQLVIRAYYSPLTNIASNLSSRPSAYIVGSTSVSDIATALVDYNVPMKSFAEEFHFQFSFFDVFKIRTPANSITSTGEQQWKFYSMDFEFKGLGGGLVDQYISVVRSDVTTKKLITILSTGQSYGILNDGLGTMSSYSFLLTTKYDLPKKWNTKFIFGHELLYTLRNFQSPAGTYNYLDQSRFYATSGYGVHLFLNYKLFETVLLRVGGRYQRTKYDSDPLKFNLGEQDNAKKITRSFYTALDFFF